MNAGDNVNPKPAVASVTAQLPLTAIVDHMLSGDLAACYEFLRHQNPAEIPAFVRACTTLGQIARNAMLRDPATFLKHKFRPVTLNKTVFRQAVEAALRADLDHARNLLIGLDLDALGMFSTLSYHIATAQGHLHSEKHSTTPPATNLPDSSTQHPDSFAT